MHKVAIGTGKLVLLALIMFTLVLGFQNCSRSVFFAGLPTSSSKSLMSGGNGGTYDGKPKRGNYYRYDQNGCMQTSTAKNVIGLMTVDGDRALITNDVCISMNYSVQFFDSRFQFAPYNPDYIGFNAAIFEHGDGATFAGKVDLWCRHTKVDFGLDIVLRSDLSGGSPQGILYTGSALNSSTPLLSPKRVLAVSKATVGQSLSLVSTDVDLKADVDLASESGGIYAARAQLTLDGVRLDLPMSCRLHSPDAAVYSRPLDVLAMYQFDGGPVANGSSIPDSSANSIAGRIVNPDGLGVSYAAAPRARAIGLDDTDSYIDVSSLAPMAAAGGEFSVSLWLNAAPNITDKATIFAINTSIGQNVLKIASGGCTGTQDRERLTFETGNNCFDTGARIVDGGWHLVTATLAAGQISMYLDGVSVGSQPAVFSLSVTDVWSIGMDLDPGGAGDFWLGSFDEVVFWKKALSAAEIAKQLK